MRSPPDSRSWLTNSCMYFDKLRFNLAALALAADRKSSVLKSILGVILFLAVMRDFGFGCYLINVKDNKLPLMW